MRPFSLNIRGKLLNYEQPAVMGILNATPDSFFSDSCAVDPDHVRSLTELMVKQGADFIDVGAFSSRPGHQYVEPEIELERLSMAMNALRSVAPDIPVSVDTFRADVARVAITELGADIINDISGGNLDPKMIDTVAELHAPYVLMHMRGTPATMQQYTDYTDLIPDILHEIADKYVKLSMAGACDVIIDPGFGFSKTLEQNYTILRHLDLFEIFQAPLLVGLSRKSMITQLLNVDASNALQGTIALNMAAMQRGASILRVHDVEAAVHAVKIYSQVC